MIWTIAHREIRDHILSLRFYLGFALCLVLMVVGALVGAEEQGQQRENLAPFLDPGQYAEAAEWANPNSLMNGALFLSRPLPSLRSLVYGLDNLSFLAQVKSANYILYLREPLVGNPLPALFAIHSFTPILDGVKRPWHVGLLYKDDDRLARPLIAAFEAFAGVQVGDNLPYSGFDPAGYAIHVHGAALGIPHVVVELRQDLIDTHHGAEAWAGRLAAAIRTTVRQSQPWEMPGH